MTTDSSQLRAKAERDIAEAVTTAFERFLSTARERVLGTSTTADATPADLPPNLDRWPDSSVWVELVRQIIAPAIGIAFDEAFDAAARADALEIHRYRQTFMDEVHDRLSRALWTDTTFERIRGDLAEGTDSGDSVPRLRARISDQLQVSANAYLADRIARTEAHTATEGGTHAAMRAYEDASGEVMHQQWIATADARTRASHLAASGQRVRLTGTFTVGGESLRYPGDPLGPAHTTVMCRCSTLTGTTTELDDLPPSAADTQGSAMTTPATDPYADPPETPPEYWRGVLAPLDVRGDFRILASPEDGEVPTTDLMWLSWQERAADGHDGKVAVGRIDRVWIGQDGNLWGEGAFDLNDETGTAPMVARKVADGFAGTVSVDTTDLTEATIEFLYVDRDDNPVDVDDMDIDDLIDGLDSGELRELLRISGWRLGGATLVQDPAFATSRDGKSAAFIEIVDPPEGEGGEDASTVVAAVVGDANLPLAERDTSWDGPAALGRLQEAERLNGGCFWRDDDADSDSTVQADYALPFADVIDGELRAVPAGIFAVAGVLQGGRGGVDLPEETQDAIRGRVSGYYARMRDEWDDPDVVPPWDDDTSNDDDSASEEATVAALTAAAGIAPDTATWAEQVASGAPMEPPQEFFTNPNLSGPTKVRVTSEGRVYGHVACWTTNHISFPGQSVRPPRSHTNYAHFQRNRVRCAGGGLVFAGAIVMGTSHADLHVSNSAAMHHYDHTGHAVADVVCGEDAHGIWLSGCLKPGVSALQVLTLDRYSLSGDWRDGELVGVCVVNVPGFPISDAEANLTASACGTPMETPRPRYRDADGVQVAVVAAGVVAPERPNRAAPENLVRTLDSLLDEKLSTIVDQVSQHAYVQSRRAAQEEREMRGLARQVNASAIEEARSAIEKAHSVVERGREG